MTQPLAVILDKIVKIKGKPRLSSRTMGRRSA